ncbi:aspartate-semialdehyde dehydrogenase [Blattabacterium sp. (Blatta orientalis) str. Tarazona]|uniref:aspartate-semialdehyde dehydrogenase n=1 Tax=Blattabacterium sp. (Blatta orientalis) TaxID=367806 RepID=UPI0002AD75DE|nr:aspartate-semialdehyde dehydrogenase [Blattabacterium sp. (Blatta orientalis)]AGD98190.1 aspartate-semialdehyde dehydrogenase [Blattabacterium sp. (Blatta orientalis) str. Tarazona]
MKLGIVGVTGMVGRVMMEVLETRNFPVKELYLSASEKSIGKEFFFRKKKYPIIGIQDLILKNLDVVLFSAGSSISKEWAPRFSKIGTTVIDNSSAWRMDPDKKLVVPEINISSLSKKDKIIANPNCSTIQLVMILHPLHLEYGINRVIVSTYQSVTGTGKKAIDQLNSEKKSLMTYEKVYPYPIYQNVLPHCDSFGENGYTVEEIKLMRETKKIINDQNIAITATAVRVPVIGGHSESVNVTFKREPNIDHIYEIFSKKKGIVVQDNPKKNIYPMPLFAHGKDEVFVGRIRKDYSCSNSLNFWIVADNLRKGAATNAIQIVESLIEKKYI